MTEDEEKKQKGIEYYSASVGAWYATALEHDKSLLVLSAGGIGLLITLLTTIGVSSVESFILYIFAIISFITCCFSVLTIFRFNKKYIENLLSGKTSARDPLLSTLDTVSLLSFGIGVLFAAIIGIAVAFHSLIHKEIKMSSNKDSVQTPQPRELKKSFNGANNLQPGAKKESSESSNPQKTPETIKQSSQKKN